MTHSIPVTLPGGLRTEEGLQKDIHIRSLTGDDELYLDEMKHILLPVQRTTVLLSRCLMGIGDDTDARTRVVRNLSMGDREALVLHIRRLTLGEDIHCSIRCTEAECREMMDISLKVQDLLVDPHIESPRTQEENIEVRGRDHRIAFRLPNGGDIEEAAAMVNKDLDSAILRVVSNCTEDLDGSGQLDPSVLRSLMRRFNDFVRDKDPQTDVRLSTKCPYCGSRISVPLDACDLLFKELAVTADALITETRVLAEWFHWSEGEILSMTPTRRRSYIRKIYESLIGGDLL